MVATEQLLFDILARDNASAALLKAGASADKASGSLAGLARRLDEVSRKSVQARVGLTGDVQANASIDKIQARLITLGRQTANPNISMEGAARAAAQIAGLDAELDKLKVTEKEVAATSWVSALGDAASVVSRPLGSGSWLSQLVNFHVPLFAGALTKVGLPAILATASGIHLLSEAVIEATAVVVPASIALGAFGVGAAPTVAAIYAQMKNLYTVSQALDTQMPGLSGGFSKMVTAVKPEVYSIFGDALEIVNHQGTALSTMATGAGAALDQLASRFTLAWTAGSGVNKFAQDAVGDFSRLGDVVGNLGGAFGNLMHVMPGYANDLLSFADAGSKVLEWVTRIAEPVIGFGLSMHGAIFYVGLLTTALVKLGTTVIPAVGLMAVSAGAKLGILGEGALGAAKALGATDTKLASIADNLGGVIGPRGFAKVGEDAEAAAGKTGILGTALGVLTKVPVWGWVALGAAAVGFLTFKMLTAKDATTQWADALLAAAQNEATFTGVISATDAAMAKIGVAYAGATSSLKILKTSTDTFGASQAELTQQYAIQAQRANDLNAARKQGSTLQATESTRAGQLVTTFGSLSKAMGVFALVNIKANALSKDTASQWAEDIQTAKGYLSAVTELAGYQGGRALAAQQAMTLAQSDQAKAVAQVTQAEDQYISVLTGGEQAFITWAQDLSQIRTDAAKTGASLGGLSKNSLTLASDFWTTLIPAGQKQIDALNAQFIGTKNLTTATATIAKGLLPYAKGNDAARVAVMDLVNNALGPGTVTLKNMNQWVGANSTSLHGFKSIVDQSAVSASSLAKGLQQDLNVQFHQALLQSSGADVALKAYTADLDHNRQNIAQGHNDRKTLIADLENAGLSAKQATSYVNGLSASLGKIPKNEYTAIHMTGSGTYSIHQGGAYIQGAHGHIPMPAAASGMYVSRGTTPKADDVIVRASKGELIVPTAMVNAGYVDHLRGKIPGFASGGIAPSYSGPVAGLSPWIQGDLQATAQTMEQSLITAMRSAIKTAQSTATSAAGYTGNTGGGAVAALAQRMAAARGWTGAQWLALNSVEMAEAGWNLRAQNPTSAAYGIAQFIGGPGEYATYGGNAGTAAGQVTAFENYVAQRYHTPEAAWAHEQAYHWYRDGLEPTIFSRPTLIGVGEAGPERVSVEPLPKRGGRGADGPLVVMNGTVIREDADVNLLAQKLDFRTRASWMG